MRVGVFTGTRADYGLLEPLISELKRDPGVTLQLLVSGMHLSPEFGLTHREIDGDGCSRIEKVEMLLSSDTPVGISKAMGLGMISLSEALQRLDPDILVGLGDRYELFAAAAAATVLRIPIAHLQGGETTEGAIDEPFRHAITKMSHIHFASTEAYRKRIIQLGEHPDRVHHVGAIGLDHLKTRELLSRDELEREIGFRITENTVLATFHPVTLENATAGGQFSELLEAFDHPDGPGDGLRVIFTLPNADTDGRVIITMINDYVRKHPDRAVSFVSLGQLRYLSLLSHVSCVAGNSSSGIIEAPSVKTGTVNIGDRQKGRIKADSVIDCPPRAADIATALKRCMSREFQSSLKGVINPYEPPAGRAAPAIREKLLSASPGKMVKKPFYDIDFDC